MLQRYPFKSREPGCCYLNNKKIAFVRMGTLGEISAKLMLGEYCVYSDGKFFGLICNDRLFINPIYSRSCQPVMKH
jgi:hypothetical protein